MTKYLIVTLISLAAYPTLSSAQAPTPQAPPAPEAPAASERRVQTGLRVGLNFSSFVGDIDDSTQNRRVGLVVGGFVTIQVASVVAFQPEIYYSQQGIELINGRGTVELSYLSIPLLLRGELSVGPSVSMHIVGGPYIASLLSAKGKSSGQVDDLKSRTESLDLGIVLGAGLDVPLQRGGLSFEARYSAGLRSVDPGDPDIKNRVMSVLAGYYF